MTYAADRPRKDVALRVTEIGSCVIRYGLALVIGWIELMKFTGYEAQGIQPFVAHSPVGWLYDFLTMRQFSDALEIVELSIAIMIALSILVAKASAIGSAAAVLMFLTTLSFLFQPSDGNRVSGFPALSAGVGQFLLKDLVLLGVATWSLGEALSARRADPEFRGVAQ